MAYEGLNGRFHSARDSSGAASQGYLLDHSEALMCASRCICTVASCRRRSACAAAAAAAAAAVSCRDIPVAGTNCGRGERLYP
eukprot:521970-Pyramimonas_sp.AAC.2